MMLVNSRSEQAVIGAQQGRSQYMYRVYLLSENGMVLADPLLLPPLGDKVGQVTLVDGWALLSTQNATVAVPMPAGPP